MRIGDFGFADQRPAAGSRPARRRCQVMLRIFLSASRLEKFLTWLSQILLRNIEELVIKCRKGKRENENSSN
jgi:hypothetical protein